MKSVGIVLMHVNDSLVPVPSSTAAPVPWVHLCSSSLLLLTVGFQYTQENWLVLLWAK